MSPTPKNAMEWIAKGLSLIPAITAAINAVERFVKAKGADKQAAALDMAQIILAATEGMAGKDLLNDEDVRDAAKKVIDAQVALQNVIARKNIGQ